MTEKLTAGSPFPETELPVVGGGSIRLGGPRDGWQMIVVYRGRHCPLCKKYLTRLEQLKAGFEGIATEIVAVSADPLEKAEADKADLGLTMPVAYGLDGEGMRGLGLYVSEPRSPEETDRPFAEPALFVVNPAGDIQIVDLSNAPFARPDLDNILGGLTFIQANDYPIRGTGK